MKKIIITALIIMMATFTGGFEARAQAVKRLQFAKGKNSATVRDNTGRSGVYYDLRVKGGQKMALKLTPNSKVGIKIERDGGGEVLLREERGGSYELYFEEGGDISIFVGSTNGRPAAFALTVTIAKMANI